MVTTTTGLATSFITFTRTSNATVTDSNGFIKWAGHNLLTNSESFDASAWTKTALTVTANSAVAPNGTTTADKLIPSATSNYHSLYQGSIVSGVGYSVSVYAKAAGYNFLYVANSSTTASAIFNLSTGAVSSTGAGATSSITSLADGWYLCTISFTSTSTNAIEFGVSSTSTWGVFTGDGTSGILLWGAHLYRSDLGGMVLNPARGDAYYPTTPRNLLGFTEDFSNAAWSRSGTNVTSNTLLAPNGLQTADLISNTTSASSHGVYQTISFSAACTMSIYAKAGTSNFVGLTNTSSTTPAAYSGAVFNLAAGTVTLSNNCTATITSVGNGWYRCAIAALTVAGSFFVVSVAENGTNAPWNGYTGGDQSIYLWGAQLSDSASLDAYSPVYGAAVTSAAYYAPRLDFDPVTLAAKGLLVEEQRANLFLHSAAFDNANWDKNNTTATANAATAPDGTASADLIVPTTTAGVTHSAYQSVTVTAADHSLSFFVKAAGYTKVKVANLFTGAGVSFDVSSGTVGTASAGNTGSISSVGNGWFRCVITFTAVSATTLYGLYVEDASGNVLYAGDGTSGVLVWGAQLEAGSFATSYIPTGAATATRTADVASVSTQAFPYSATEGTVVVSADAVGGFTSSNNAQVSLNDGSGNNAHLLYLSAAAPTYLTNVGGSAQQNMTISSVTVSANTPFKSGFAYKQNDFAGTANGATVATDTSGTIPSGATTMNIGNFASNLRMNGHIRQITYIPRRLSNTELQARTV